MCLVSIRCLVYNHEAYLRQCLDGFVMQKTNFRFEAIVHDDASTDGSAAIIREYAEKYPDIIKPIFETENQYSKRDGSLRRIMDEACKGKYIAMCEGDDYWTDPFKLQKQVDFLESHSEYSMCFTNAEVKYEQGVPIISAKLYDNIQEGEYSGGEILRRWTIPTASVVYRNYYLQGEYLPQDKRFLYGDTVLFLWLSKKGKLWCINDNMVVYRKNMGGISFVKKSYDSMINHWLAIKDKIGFDKDVEFVIVRYLAGLFIGGRLGKQSIYAIKEAVRLKYFFHFVCYLPIHLCKMVVVKLK